MSNWSEEVTMSQWLNYNHLYYFWVIAKEGSISKASEKLSVGQPALSMQLKQLEEALDYELFERKSRSLHLTDSGRVVFKYANDIFSMGNEMLEVLKDSSLQQSTINLSLGALDSVPKNIVSLVIEKALSIADCKITITEGPIDQLMRELSNHSVDIVISNHPFPTNRIGFYSKSVAKLPVYLYGSKEDQALKKDFPQSIKNKKLILPTSHSKLRSDLDHYFQLKKIDVQVVAETQDTSLQKLLGAKGVGLVPLPYESDSLFVGKKELFEIGPFEHVFEEIYFFSANRKIVNPLAAQILKEFSL